MRTRLRPGSSVPNVVVIFSKKDDIHAAAVAAEIAATFGGRPLVLDTAAYPDQWRLTWTLAPGAQPEWLLRTGKFTVDAAQLAGVWWRRPAAHRISTKIKQRRVRNFCYDEARAAFLGWMYGLRDRAINPVAAESVAIQKPFQLLKASEAGLKIPETLVSNDPQEVRRFLDSRRRGVIFKTLTGASWQAVETRKYLTDYDAHLDSVRYAPVIFQQLIEARCDIRASIVDDKVFAVSIKPGHVGARLDWRLDGAAAIKPHRLPPQLRDALIALLRNLGLRFGAVDLRLTPKGEYVFLEINPSGQFLFCEIHGAQRISRALAASLLFGRGSFA